MHLQEVDKALGPATPVFKAKAPQYNKAEAMSVITVTPPSSFGARLCRSGPLQKPRAAQSEQAWEKMARVLPGHSPAYQLIGQVFKSANVVADAAATTAWMVPGLHAIALAMKRMEIVMNNNRSADVRPPSPC